MPKNSLGPVVLDVAGIELSEEEKDILRHPQVGGLILFSRNFESEEQLAGLVAQVREVRASLLISVDHEGGRVQRFKSEFTHLPPMQCFTALAGGATELALQQAKECGWLMAAELLAFDIDISYAPILDLDDSHSDIIGNRSFSTDPHIATALAGAFIEGMQEAGMAATGKHFPGHGGVKEDSHLTLPVDNRSRTALDAHDLIPFVALQDKLAAMMSAHIVFPEIDEQLVSFSHNWLTKILRHELGYEGLVFSDDLSMEGAASAGGSFERARLAIEAGCDAVLVCNQPQQAIEIIEALEREQRFFPERSLAALKKRRTHDNKTLRTSERWRQARALAQSLHEKI